MVVFNNKRITSANVASAAELLVEPAKSHRNQGLCSELFIWNMAGLLSKSKGTLTLESSEKQSPSMASPPTLPSEHPKLDCKGLSPRISWIKISPYLECTFNTWE